LPANSFESAYALGRSEATSNLQALSGCQMNEKDTGSVVMLTTEPDQILTEADSQVEFAANRMNIEPVHRRRERIPADNPSVSHNFHARAPLSPSSAETWPFDIRKTEPNATLVASSCRRC
jgi:hypothetical protein